MVTVWGCGFNRVLFSCSLLSLALFAKEHSLVRPELVEENIIHIKGGRSVGGHVSDLAMHCVCMHVYKCVYIYMHVHMRVHVADIPSRSSV